MKIGILGTGNMGRVMGVRWSHLGHEVFFGSSDSERAKIAADLASNSAKSGSYDEAAQFGEVVVHTARDAMLSTLLSDVSVLDGKTVIETNNGPIPEGFQFEPDRESFTERLQSDVINAHVVKAFNTMAQEVFEVPPDEVRQQAVSVFMAGNDSNAKQKVSKLANDMGFAPIDFGDAYRGRLLEQLGDAIRWMIAGLGHGPFATISVKVLDPTQRDNLGGRAVSKVDA